MIVLTDEILKLWADFEHAQTDNWALKFARSIESAVLEKLKRQEPVALYKGCEGECGYDVITTFGVLEVGTELYAAPMPAEDTRIADRDSALLNKSAEAHEMRKQRDELLAAAEAVEIDAEECNDFDDCIGMFVPIDSYHKLIEVIERVK